MVLGRLIEIYQAEQKGKQIMMRVYHSGYLSSYENIQEVKITECELKDLVLDEQEDTSYTFFIKDEEDEYGNKLV
jgi:hypothetical protein